MIKKLISRLGEYKRVTILTMLGMAGEVAIETLIPFKMADLIDVGFAQGDIGYIIKTGIILLAMAAVGLGCGLCGTFLGARAATGFAKNLRKELFERVQKFSFANIDKYSTSSIITRTTTDVANVQNAFNMSIHMAIRVPLSMLFSILMTAFINWKIALIMVIAMPILAGGLILISTKVFPIFAKVFRTYDKLNNTVQENLHGIRVVKSFVRGEFEKEKFNNTSEEIFNGFYSAEKLLAWNSPMMMSVMYIVMMIIIWIGAIFIVNGEPVTVSAFGDVFTVGLLNSVFSYVMSGLMSCMGLSMIFVMLTMSRESIRRICEIFDEEPTITNPENPVMEVKDGSIEFKNVDFKYSKNAERMALSSVNLSIPSGATVGIIGGTGSSKTTLVQLIPRLYDVTEGELFVGGVNVKNYDLKTLRDAVSMVLQKNVLFAGTISDNLRWGNPDATDEEIREACHISAADVFVEERPDKYETFVEQGGTNVSGGQKQRLCIARAILKKPKILILDDSTSAVDTATDAMIQKAFREKIPHITKLIIAQRISSVQYSDMIIVMDNGMINDVGTHDELLQRNEIYREVYTSQKKGGDEDGR